jgi:hypothetical protein
MYRQPFLALITPIGSGDERPEHPIFYPPGIWGPPDMPPGFWGGGMGPGVKPQPPFPGYWPGSPPDRPRPTPPVPGWPSVPGGGGNYPGAPGGPSFPGGPPLGFWGGRPPEYVDIGGPGPQPHPEHPIVLPPESIPPDVEVPEGKSLLVLFTPGQPPKVELIPTPGPGYTPPSGGAVPTPQRRRRGQSDESGGSSESQ